jgi:hypothetical protein
VRCVLAEPAADGDDEREEIDVDAEVEPLRLRAECGQPVDAGGPTNGRVIGDREAPVSFCAVDRAGDADGGDAGLREAGQYRLQAVERDDAGLVY